jgi:hypothetical protein
MFEAIRKSQLTHFSTLKTNIVIKQMLIMPYKNALPNMKSLTKIFALSAE